MSYSPNSTIENINLGLIANHTTEIPFGRNPDVGTGAFEALWYNGGAYNWMTTASTIRILSGGDVADTAAGVGAQEVTVYGLDENWADATETIATAGAAASTPTTTTFIRVNKIEVSKCGAYGATNVGDIVFEETAGNLVVANIEAGVGRTQLGIYSVPLGKTAYIVGHDVIIASNKTADVRLMYREDAHTVATPFSPIVQLLQINDATGYVQGNHPAWHSFPAKTDMWFEGKGNGASAAITVEFDLFLVG